ncbi:DUF7848 domain-containing protein [Streptomyces sp. NPDC002643]
MTLRQPDPLDRPPVPVPGCKTCEELSVRRNEARARYDFSAETDANVLLRRHRRREHEGAATARETALPALPTRTRRIFRYVPYVIAQDQSAEPEYEATCVSGDEVECGATSGVHHDPAGVEEWQRKHTQETRHLRYRRSFGDYAVLEPLEEVPLR